MIPEDPTEALSPLRRDDGGVPSFSDDTLTSVMARGRRLRQRRISAYSAGAGLVIAAVAITGVIAHAGPANGPVDRVATSPVPSGPSPSPHHSRSSHKHSRSGSNPGAVGGNPTGHHAGGGGHGVTSPPPVPLPICDTPTAAPPVIDPTATPAPPGPVTCTPSPTSSPTTEPVPSETPTDSPAPSDSPSPAPPSDPPSPFSSAPTQ
jgi:hypothetical protein